MEKEVTSLKFKRLSPEEKTGRGILGRLYGPVASCVEATRNGRKYSEELWEKLFNSDLIKERFANGGIFGQLCHPDYEEVDMEKVACVMPEPPKKDSSGKLIGYVDILDTPCGKVAYQLAKYGYKFGISSRGTGDLIGGVDGQEVDPDTYQLNAFDLVEIPAVESARLQFVESLETKTIYNKTLKESLSDLVNKASNKDKITIIESIDRMGIELNEEEVDEHIQKLRATQLEEGKLGDVIKNVAHKVKDKVLTDHTWDEFEDAPEEIDTEHPEEIFAYLDQIEDEDVQEEFLKEFYDITQDQVDELLKEYDIRKYNAKANEDPDYFMKLADQKNESLSPEEDSKVKGLINNAKNLYTILDDEDVDKAQAKEMIDKIIEACKSLEPESITEEKADLEQEISDEKESISESCGDKDDVKEEVVNDKPDEFAAELEEALSKNKKLEEDNLSLQEKLSVCTAKETKLEEELKRYKASTAHLGATAKKIKPLKDDIASLTEELETKNGIINSNKQRFNELVDTANEAIAKLGESEKSNKGLKSKVKNLTEQLEATQVKVDNSTALVKKYQRALRESRDELVQAKADAYGIRKEDILSNLNESYNLKQLNSVCEELQERKRNISKLPFRVSSTSNVKVREAKETITGREAYMNEDDYVSDSLLSMLK